MGIYRRSPHGMWWLGVLLGVSPFLLVTLSHGQTSITSSGLNTTITQVGQDYNITGGTRPANGPNLFHSFGDFSVGTNDVARFVNDSNLPTTNILSRVTGGNVSNIFGEINMMGFIQSTPGGPRLANLYLINPAGVIFGPTARLNGGSIAISTADYLRLSDGVRFNAVPGPQDVLLSTAPVAAFGFLNTAPQPISVNGAQLEHGSDLILSLIAGDITMSGGELRGLPRPGQIDLVSVASRGEVLIDVAASGPFAGQRRIGVEPTLSGFGQLGTITLSDGATVTGHGAGESGDIFIRAGNLVMDDATLTVVSSASSAGRISIEATGNVEFRNGSSVLADATALEGGNIVIEAGRRFLLEESTVSATSRSAFPGFTGRINVTAPLVELRGTAPSGIVGLIDVTSTNGPGGSIRVQADQFQLEQGPNIRANSPEAAGTIMINATDAVRMNGGLSSISAFGIGNGDGGNISITAGESIRFTDIEVVAGSQLGKGGNIVIDAGKRVISSGSLDVSSNSGTAGNIIIQAGERIRIDGGSIVARSEGDGNGGNIFIRAPERIRIDGENGGVLVSTAGRDNAAGGNITYESEIVRLRNSTTESTAVNGPGGTITIRTNDFRNVNSTLDVQSQFGPDGSVTFLPFP